MRFCSRFCLLAYFLAARTLALKARNSTAACSALATACSALAAARDAAASAADARASAAFSAADARAAASSRTEFTRAAARCARRAAASFSALAARARSPDDRGHICAEVPVTSLRWTPISNNRMMLWALNDLVHFCNGCLPFPCLPRTPGTKVDTACA